MTKREEFINYINNGVDLDSYYVVTGIRFIEVDNPELKIKVNNIGYHTFGFRVLDKFIEHINTDYDEDLNLIIPDSAGIRRQLLYWFLEAREEVI